MPLHIEELTSDVSIMDGDVPLTEAQKEALVQMVMRRLSEKAKEGERKARATEVRRQAAKSLEV